MRYAFAPIFASTVPETLRNALRSAEQQTMKLLFERRQFCLDYYHNEVRLEDGGQNAYLKNYSGYKDKDGDWIYKNALLLEHIGLTEQIIDLKSRNYKEQPLRKIDGEEAEKYTNLLKRSKWFAVSKRVEQYTNLLHDIAVGVFLDEKTGLLRFQVVPEYYPVFDEDDPIQIDPVAIIHPTAKRDPKTGGVLWAYYDAEQTADLNSNGEIIGEVRPNTYGVLNFIFPHRKHPVLSHFSTPAVSLADANQAVDAAITGLNQALHYNAHKQMVIKGKIGETNDKGQEIQFALGNAQLIVIEPVVGSESSADVSTIDMQVQFGEMLSAIKAKMELVANSYNVQFQWKIEGGPQSGYSLEIQGGRDKEDRKQQFEIMEDHVEQPLYRVVSAMSEKFNIDIEHGELSIDFLEEDSDMSISDKIAWQKWMKESGQWGLKELIQENNPEMMESEVDDLVAKMEEQKQKNREAYGLNQSGVQTSDSGPSGQGDNLPGRRDAGAGFGGNDSSGN